MAIEKRTFTVGELVAYDSGSVWRADKRYTRVQRITPGGTVFVKGPGTHAPPLQFRASNNYRGLYKVTDHERAILAWRKAWGELSHVMRDRDGRITIDPFDSDDLDAVRTELETAAELLRTEPKEPQP
jgi:hypothetical protein